MAGSLCWYACHGYYEKKDQGLTRQCLPLDVAQAPGAGTGGAAVPEHGHHGGCCMLNIMARLRNHRRAAVAAAAPAACCCLVHTAVYV